MILIAKKGLHPQNCAIILPSAQAIPPPITGSDSRKGKAMKTQNQTTVSSKATNRAANNTPVNAFEAYVGKLDATQQKAMRAIHAEKQAKKEQAKSQQTKTGAFALVAGSIAKIEHKALKKAIEYHCKQGNLCKVSEGVKLTAQGAAKWTTERIAPNADTFQKIAAFVNGGANLPEFGGEKKTPVKIGAKQLPSLEYWGGFVTTNMRLCFASLWASK